MTQAPSLAPNQLKRSVFNRPAIERVTMNDAELLARYLEEQSEHAFADLVARHIDLVYATALRQIGDPHAAQDVTQGVFCLLLKKADGLKRTANLAGWLHRAACWKSSEHLRAQRRRHFHEHASTLQNTLVSTSTPNADPWAEIAPVLDSTLDQLDEADRELILMRFYNRLPLKQIGGQLQIGEDAARMRLQRALGRLRQKLAGLLPMAIGAGMLEELLQNRASASAPAGWATRIANAAHATATVSPATKGSPWGITARQALQWFATACLCVVTSLALFNRNVSSKILPEPTSTSSTSADRETGGATPKLTRQKPARENPTPLQSGPEADVLLARLQAILNSTVQDTSFPPQDLRDCILELGPYPEPTFQLLAATLRSTPNDGEPIASPAKSRAAWGLWLLTEQSPSFRTRAHGELLALLRNPEATNQWSEAALVMAHIGPDPRSITELAAALRSNPLAIDTCLYFWEGAARRHPDITVETLLPWLDLGLGYRFTAAHTLAFIGEEQRPEFTQILVEAIDHPFGIQSSGIRQAALKSLERLGPLATDQALWLLQKLDEPEFKASQTMRGQLLETLASVAPHFRSQVPELEQLLRRRAVEAPLEARMSNPKATIPDLVAALGSPGTSWRAALDLKAMGTAAAESLPALHKALSDTNDGFRSHRSYFADAIKAIDPHSPKPIYSRDDLIAVLRELEHKATQLGASLGADGSEWVSDFIENTQERLPTDLALQAHQLGALHPQLQKTWVEGLLKADPSLKTIFAQDPTREGRPQSAQPTSN